MVKTYDGTPHRSYKQAVKTKFMEILWHQDNWMNQTTSYQESVILVDILNYNQSEYIEYRSNQQFLEKRI